MRTIKPKKISTIYNAYIRVCACVTTARSFGSWMLPLPLPAGSWHFGILALFAC